MTMNAERARRIAEMVQNRQYHAATQLLEEHGISVHPFPPHALVARHGDRVALLTAYNPLARNTHALLHLFNLDADAPCTPCTDEETFRA